MKAALAQRFGKPSDVLSVETTEVPKLTPNASNSEVLVKVGACSLTPGDWRMLSGDTRLIKKPKSWPYIPGLDVCGEVVEVSGEGCKFKPGDRVIGSWGGLFGTGGMGEYAVVKAAACAHMPDGISVAEGAALANSSVHAIVAVERAQVKPGERVLVLGGSSGVGLSIMQLAKDAGAHFVACTSTADTGLLEQAGADRVIDYTKEDWSTNEEFVSNPFDVIFDCAVGKPAWDASKRSKAMKKKASGGRYFSFVAKEHRIVIRHAHQMVGFVTALLFKQVARAAGHAVMGHPKYMFGSAAVTSELLEKVMDKVREGKLRPILDHRSPHPFTTEGVVAAFELLAARRAHGKIVVSPIKDGN